jgi:polysaccharide biosynthesis/export protein
MTMPRGLWRLVLVVGMLLSLSNCMTDASQTANAGVPTLATADQPASALASADLPSVDYHISPRDILEVSVFQVPDLSKTVQVSDDGYISLPLIGKTKIGGDTTQEAESAIGKKLQKKYLQSPQVSVLVKNYGQRVTVSGAVLHPSVLAVDGRVTLTQAVAKAGGLNDVGNSRRVHVARSSNGRINDQVYDLDQILAGHATDPMLHGGDLVVAEESGVKVAFKNLKDMLPFAVLASLL